VRWLLVFVLACGAPPRPPQQPSSSPEQEQFYRAVELLKTKPVEALVAFEDFVSAHPDSKLRRDALLEIADLQFDEGNLEIALSMYQMARFAADDERGWYVRYKIAWCYFRLGQRERAISEMSAVAGAEWTGAKARAQLIEAAKKDVLTFRGGADGPR
jgi:predicted negative regulator of RcsB-dependent stress response